MTKILLTLACCLCLAACKSTLPVDVVQEGGEIYFVLESEREITSVRVMPAAPASGAQTLAWELRHDMTTPLEARRYPRLSHIQYGQRLAEFPVMTGPVELVRGAEYVIAIEAGDSFAQETFVLGADGSVSMPKPSFKRQRGRVYSATRGKDGALRFSAK